MARKKITQYFDDLDGSPLEEQDLHIVRFGYEGREYILDLSEENAEEFRDKLAKYIKAARLAPSTTTAKKRVKPADVREWAHRNGYNVAARGKIPTEIIQKYIDANPNV